MWKCVTKKYNLQTISNSYVSGGGCNFSLNFIDHVLLKKRCHQNTQNVIIVRINIFFARSPRKHCMPLCKLAEWIKVVDTQ